MADENDQHDEPSVNDVPEGPPDPPAPPNEPTNLQKEPASVELKGERKSVASSDDACTNDEADAHQEDGEVQVKLDKNGMIISAWHVCLSPCQKLSSKYQ